MILIIVTTNNLKEVGIMEYCSYVYMSSGYVVTS